MRLRACCVCQTGLNASSSKAMLSKAATLIHLAAQVLEHLIPCAMIKSFNHLLAQQAFWRGGDGRFFSLVLECLKTITVL